MDVSSDISLPSVKVKHRFYQWATKWFHGSVEQSTDPPDVANLVCLLQSLGCHLREFNKNDATDDGIKQDSIRIIMECGSSRMRAVMELDEVVCRCQTKDDVKDASFWSVSGTARGGSVDSVNKFEETGSNLLPQVSKDHRALIHDVLYRLLATINSGDINQNRSSLLDVSFNQTAGSQLSPSDKSDSIARSNTQPEIFRSKNVEHTFATPSPIGAAERRMSISAQNILKLPIITKTIPTPELKRRPILHRQKTWDLEGKGDSEPRPSPPKISSSPVVLNELCSSLDQVSLHSDGDNSNIGLAECLMKIQMYANRALNLCGSPSKDEGLLRPSQQKLSPGSQPGSACSSPATMTSKDAVQIIKPLTRKSIGTTQPTKQLTVLRGTPSKLPPKRKSPTPRLMAAGGQKTPVRRTPGLKKDSTFPTSTSNSSLSSSSDSRAVVCARRRVSPDPRSPAVRPGNLSLRSTTISKPGISSSSSQKAASTPKSSVSSGDSLSSDANQKKIVSPNPQVKKTGGTTPASRLNVLKKEK